MPVSQLPGSTEEGLRHDREELRRIFVPADEEDTHALDFGGRVGGRALFVSFVTTVWPSAMMFEMFGAMSTETVARWIDSTELIVGVLMSLPFLRCVS